MYFTIADQHSLYHTRLSLSMDLQIIGRELLMVHGKSIMIREGSKLVILHSIIIYTGVAYIVYCIVTLPNKGIIEVVGVVFAFVAVP